MSKAILILDDMPKSCDKCPVFNSDFYTCQLVFGELYEEARKGIRHENCPLKPLPNEISHSEIEDEYEYWRIEGYNQCLKEILGEKE